MGIPLIPKPAVSVIAGVLFGVSWLVLIDGHVYADHFERHGKIEWWYYMPGLVGTIALLMTNIVTLEELNPSAFFDETISTRLRAWLFTAFFLSFGAITTAVWLMKLQEPHFTNSQWPGIALMLQSVLLFLSSLLFLYSKSGDDDDYANL